MNTEHLTAILCESGKRKLGITSLAVLVHCAEHEGITLTKLAAMLGKSTANLTGIADKLQDRLLVRRRSIPGDRRSWTLKLTPQGFAMLQTILFPNNNTNTKANA